MIRWQPHLPRSSFGLVSRPARADTRALALAPLSSDQTGVFKIPPPDAASQLASTTACLLSTLGETEALRSPLLRELAQLARELGANNQTLVALARRVVRAHARGRSGERVHLELIDVPARRKKRWAGAVEIATG